MQQYVAPGMNPGLATVNRSIAAQSCTIQLQNYAGDTIVGQVSSGPPWPPHSPGTGDFCLMALSGNLVMAGRLVVPWQGGPTPFAYRTGIANDALTGTITNGVGDEYCSVDAHVIPGPGNCQVDIPNEWAWKQYDSRQYDSPWATDHYDHSYRSNTTYTSRDTVKAASTGPMELIVGKTSYSFTLDPAHNNLQGLVDTLNGLDVGVYAKADSIRSKNYWRLSLYNVPCEEANCYPQDTLELYDGTSETGTAILSPKRMKDSGCAVTLLAVVLKAKGINATSIGTLDPGSLNQLLSNTVAAFDSVGRLSWENAVRAIGRSINNPKLVVEPVPNQKKIESLDRALCTDGVPAIAKVKSKNGDHFVVVKGRHGTATDGSQYEIMILVLLQRQP